MEALRSDSLVSVQVVDSEQPKGLTWHEAEQLLHEHGKNVIDFHKQTSWFSRLLHNFLHPFNLLLVALAIISAATKDFRTMIIMLLMVIVSVTLKFVQEMKSEVAAQALKTMVDSKAVVMRGFRAPDHRDPTWDDVKKMESGARYKCEIPMENVVPGDIVVLTVGDMIPGDVRLVESKDLFISQSTLTGEVLPLEKKVMSDADLVEKGFSLDPVAVKNAAEDPKKRDRSCKGFFKKSWTSLSKCAQRTSTNPQNSSPKPVGQQLASVTKYSRLERPDLCFMGTNVISGTAKAIVLQTGPSTLFGEIAKELAKDKPPTAFHTGIKHVSNMFLLTMAVMVPAVFLITGLINHNWLDSFLFSIAIAVGLTPEMLPMIVTGNLAKSAITMAKKKCIVKRLDSIINLGAMDVLCTDKTGTLTQDKVVLIMHVGPKGQKSFLPLELAFLNSYFQTGFKNLIDIAVIDFFNQRDAKVEIAIDDLTKNYNKVDEIPFDFVRRRMSVILEHSGSSSYILVSKGAMEEMMTVCTHVANYESEEAPYWNSIENGPQEAHVVPMSDEITKAVYSCSESLNRDGLRVVAVAYKKLSHWSEKEFQPQDENDLIFAGFVAFLDPPKESTAPAIKELMARGVTLKVLTGDMALVCQKICKQVGLPVDGIVTTNDLAGLDDDQLFDLAEKTTIFAQLTPMQKSRIVRVLKRKHIVGFLGDGINDAAALKEADVSCSVDTAVDVAKEAADFILLEKDLLVFVKAVVLGRKTFGNTIKYIKMAVSSNFGNVFSVLVASAWLPFLPMLPIHLLLQNLLYDFSQIAIPWDSCDEDFLEKPKTWSSSSIVRFMLCIGPLSSIFDVLTFCFMWFFYNCRTPEKQTLFQTAWFVEGLLTQTCIVHMIRTDKIPFIQSTASKHLLYGTLIIMVVGIAIPFSPVAHLISMQPLPAPYFGFLACAVLGYCLLSQFGKILFIRAFKEWI